jgi:threonine dehydrogenase-like Zn-dependent dehydrogenase
VPTSLAEPRRLRLDGAGRVRLVPDDRNEQPPEQVVVAVLASALCGSEVALLRAGHDGNAGHEACGRIVSAPDGTGYDVGDLVGVTAVRGCGACGPCAAGRETRCRQGPQVQIGMHADRIAVHPSQLRRLPAGVTPVEGVLLSGDALGVPVRALRRVPTPADGRVLVVGLGPVGLAHVLVRAFTGAEVHAVEPSAYRRELALRLGATSAVVPGTEMREAELVVEATGRPEGVRAALDAVACGGTVLQSGECSRVEVSPSEQLVRREVTWTGSWYYASEDYPEMLRLQAAGLDAAALVTHELPAGHAQEAVDAFLSGDTGKVVLRWDEDGVRSPGR